MSKVLNIIAVLAALFLAGYLLWPFLRTPNLSATTPTALDLFTGVLALVAVLQLYLLFRSERIATDNLAATTKAANAAEEAAKVAKSALSIGQRAYVFLDPDRPLESIRIEVGKEIVGMLRVKNTGATPAYNIIALRGTAIGPWPLPNNTDLTIPPTVEGSQISPPGAITYWSFGGAPTPAVVSQADFDAAKQGTLRFYIFGKITYSDIFGDAHYTNFCLAVNPPADPNSAEFGLRRCAQHNDAN